MNEFHNFEKDISETVRLAVDALPKDMGETVRNAMGEFFDDEAGAEAEALERTFDVGPHGEISVSNVSGKVTIRGANVSTITIRATKRGSRRRMEHTRIETEHTGDRVSVRTRGEHAALAGVRGNVCSVDYDIEVPSSCEVQVEGVSADVSVRFINGDVGVKAVSGDIDIEGTKGRCSIITVSGDVRARTLTGELELRTTSGDATVRSSRLQRFNLNTVSGDLSIETPLTTGEHYLARTTSGDLRIAVPEGTGATVQMKSVSGDVSSDLPAQIIKSSRRNWQGRINGGGANVEMNSVSGDLRISVSSSRAAGEPGARVEPDPMPSRPAPEPLSPIEPGSSSNPDPTSGDTSAVTATVLQRLAQGEISVDDAMAELDAAER